MHTKTQINKSNKIMHLFESKGSNLLDLFDEIYKDIDKKQKDPQEKFSSFRDEISLYLKGISAPAGSSRMALMMPDGNSVLKIALNEAGFAQNGIEATIGMDDDVSDIVVPVLNKSKIMDFEGYLWIVSKKVTPLNEKNVKYETWKHFADMLSVAAKSNDPIESKDIEKFEKIEDADKTKAEIPKGAAEKLRKSREETTEEKISKAFKNANEQFFENFRNFIKRYPKIAVADLLKESSWGLDSSGNLKLLDYGYTRRVAKGFYKKGLAKGSKDVQASMTSRETERQKNIEDAINQNISIITGSNLPRLSSLPMFLRGVLTPLPAKIENYKSGGLAPLSQTELTALSKVIRTNNDKIESYIQKFADMSLQKKLYDELEEILASTGSLQTAKTENLLRMLVRETVRYNIR